MTVKGALFVNKDIKLIDPADEHTLTDTAQRRTRFPAEHCQIQRGNPPTFAASREKRGVRVIICWLDWQIPSVRKWSSPPPPPKSHSESPPPLWLFIPAPLWLVQSRKLGKPVKLLITWLGSGRFLWKKAWRTGWQRDTKSETGARDGGGRFQEQKGGVLLADSGVNWRRATRWI